MQETPKNQQRDVDSTLFCLAWYLNEWPHNVNDNDDVVCRCLKEMVGPEIKLTDLSTELLGAA